MLLGSIVLKILTEISLRSGFLYCFDCLLAHNQLTVFDLLFHFFHIFCYDLMLHGFHLASVFMSPIIYTVLLQIKRYLALSSHDKPHSTVNYLSELSFCTRIRFHSTANVLYSVVYTNEKLRRNLQYVERYHFTGFR